jgi:hypothetical protein
MTDITVTVTPVVAKQFAISDVSIVVVHEAFNWRVKCI